MFAFIWLANEWRIVPNHIAVLQRQEAIAITNVFLHRNLVERGRYSPRETIYDKPY